jgi:hypothetical protein
MIKVTIFIEFYFHLNHIYVKLNIVNLMLIFVIIFIRLLKISVRVYFNIGKSVLIKMGLSDFAADDIDMN